MTVDDFLNGSFSTTQKLGLDRAWRTLWKRGKIPTSSLDMLIKLRAKNVAVPECSHVYTPRPDEPLPEWQQAMCKRGFNPDDRYQMQQTGNENLAKANKAKGAEKAVDVKIKRSKAIIAAYKAAHKHMHGLSGTPIPRAIEVAKWWIESQGLSMEDKPNLVKRLKNAGSVR